MMKILLIATIQYFIARQTLATYPICFSVDGSPAKTRVTLADGEEFDVLWDGNHLNMEKIEPVNRIWKFISKNPPPNKPPKDNKAEKLPPNWGCAIAIVIVVVFWITVAIFLKGFLF